MKRHWRYWFGALLLAAGLCTGCADMADQPAQSMPAPQIQEIEEVQETETPQEIEEVQETETPQEVEEVQETETPQEVEEVQEAETSQETQLSEDGSYTSKEEVAEYIALYGRLPDNFITKKEAKALGWVSSEGNLGEVAPGKSIGGDYFGNFEGNLPEKEGREYHECDIDSDGGYRGAKRIVYSNDGLVYYTEDHYETFELLYGEE